MVEPLPVAGGGLHSNWELILDAGRTQTASRHASWAQHKLR